MSAARPSVRRALGAVPAFIALLIGVALAGMIAMAVSPTLARAQESFGISSSSTTLSTLQAGAHADVTTSFALNTDAEGHPIDQVKDVHFELPPGLLGDPRALPRCTPYEFSLFSCLPADQVGVLTPTFVFPGGGTATGSLPVYNLTPSAGHVATFGVSALFITIIVQVDLPNGGSGGLLAAISDLTTLVPLQASSLTLWGVPADPSHNAQRTSQLGGEEQVPAGVPPAALMTNPTDCTDGPLVTVVRADSWQQPGDFLPSTNSMPAPTGCERLQISPTLSVTPDTTQADTPAGYTIDLKSQLDEEPYGLATPPLRTVSVMLPPGTSISPAIANGLEGCSEAQHAAGSCPSTSKIGTVSIISPAVADPLTGSVYLASPTPTEMYRVFLTASADGVAVTLTGHLHPDPQTGQVTAVFDQIPQQPVSDLRISFFGGPLAALANPLACGPAKTTSQITSFAGQTVSLSSSFVVDGDGHGGACPASPPFNPTFTAGTTSPVGGDSSAFTLTVSRGDGQQDLSGITAQLPAGVFAMLGQVPPCGEAQAALGICSSASQIGTVTIAAGAGAEPFYLTGSVYLTGPYGAGPFGLSIVIPAIAGPFDLGTVVVRAAILVNPVDLRVTIAADPLPQILDGIPLRLQTVNIMVNRPGFILNPSDCTPQTVTGSVTSLQGVSAMLSTPFEVSGCAELPLAPKLSAATQAKASATGQGADLDVDVTDSGGARANIRSVVVELPGRLRPRLSTIQQACPVARYLADPAACPASSLVGAVTVNTPALATPLTGSIYLVFRGGTAYPDLMMQPQAMGVSAALDGALNVSSAGVLSAAFRALPDVPISSLALELPRSSHSLLGSTGSLCSARLSIPYTITGQNEARIAATASVAVKGCPSSRTMKRKTRRRLLRPASRPASRGTARVRSPTPGSTRSDRRNR